MHVSGRGINQRFLSLSEEGFGRVEAATTVANRPAIIPSIAGWARMTGYNTIFIDDRDPFAHGFVVK